jgi:hypothetical protein
VFEDVLDEVFELVFEDVFELVLLDVLEEVFELVFEDVFELELVLWAYCTPTAFAAGASSKSRIAACAVIAPAVNAATLAKVEIVMVFMDSLHH